MNIEALLQEVLTDIEPMLRAGGRSIRLIEANDQTCTIELSVFCGGCACTENYTAGIEERLRERAPSLREIHFIQV